LRMPWFSDELRVLRHEAVEASRNSWCCANSCATLHVSIRPHTSACVSIRQHTSADTGALSCTHTTHTSLARAHTHTHTHTHTTDFLGPVSKVFGESCRWCVSIRQHTSAYVSIRQHTSAYVFGESCRWSLVSIRQHTSAYVSIIL
jgi:hypothetical protein